MSEFNVSRGHRQYNYEKSGRKPWKLPPDVQSYIIRRMLSLRSTEVVTSVSLQADLARHKGIDVDDATIRKLLKKRGYRWLPRCQTRKYSTQHKAVRARFAKQVLRLTKAKLKEKLCLSLDGVVLSKPPENSIDCFNYCWGGESKMWRKTRESNLPSLAGDDEYMRQVPLSRAIPLWGGISDGGFAPVLWHPFHKTNQHEWSKAVRQGKLTGAIRSLNPVRRHGPYTVLCDGESFLRAKESMKAYRLRKVVLWTCPAKSPDLNPVEMFWAWLRKKLRRMDLADLKKKRKPLTKTAYTLRVKSVIRTAKAQQVAKNCAGKFRSACQQVVDRSGAAADN